MINATFVGLSIMEESTLTVDACICWNPRKHTFWTTCSSQHAISGWPSRHTHVSEQCDPLRGRRCGISTQAVSLMHWAEDDAEIRCLSMDGRSKTGSVEARSDMRKTRPAL